MPITIEAFNELKHFFVLTILAEYPSGITGYRLQQRFNFPRGSMLRVLDDLVEQGHASTQETVEDGRNQKLFTLSEAGKEHLERLKEKWAVQLAMLSEIAPPDKYANPFSRHRIEEGISRRIDRCKDKEQAIDVLRGYRSFVKEMLDRHERRVKKFGATLDTLNTIIDAIEAMPVFDKDKAMAIIDQQIEAFKEG